MISPRSRETYADLACDEALLSSHIEQIRRAIDSLFREEQELYRRLIAKQDDADRDEAVMTVIYNHREKIGRAAFHAGRVLPGALGRYLAQELLSWEAFAWQFGGEGRMVQIVDEILALEIPQKETEDANPGDRVTDLAGACDHSASAA
jgi:hypothetical protein